MTDQYSTEFRYQRLPQTVVFGRSVIGELADVLGDRTERALLICGSSVARNSDVADRVEAALAEKFAGRFEGSMPHSPTTAVAAAVEQARQVDADTVVTVGGGSTTTIGKGVALLLGYSGALEDFRIRFEPPDTVIYPTQPLPEVTTRVVAVPTTLGCAEAHPAGGGFTDPSTGEKLMIFGDGRTLPACVVVDGRALASTPTSIQRSTIVGQLRMAIESYIATKHNSFGDAYALRAIQILSTNLRAGWSDDLDYLLSLRSASMLAGYAVIAGQSTLGVNTALAHQLGAFFNIPHGEANAVLLPHTIRFNAEHAGSRMQDVAEIFCGRRFSDPTAAGEALAIDIADLVATLGIPTSLADYDVPVVSLRRVAEFALHDRSLATNPRPITTIDPLIELLERAW